MTLLALLDIISILDKYGIGGLIFVVVVVIIYLLFKNSNQRIKDQDEKISSLYGRIDGLINKMSNGNGEPDLASKFYDFAENANKIQILLYHMLRTLNADRISIHEFHNGGNNLQGVEFKKCSNTYEAVELKVKPIIKEMQNLPLSINPLWNKLLSEKKPIRIPSVSSLDDTFLKEYLEAQSVKSYYSILLTEYDKSPIGFISLDYYNKEKKLNDFEFNEFEDVSIKISTLININ